MEKALFVYNSHAGKGTLKSKLSDVLEIFRRADFEVNVFPTLEQGDAVKIVREQGIKYDRVICAGGDGTLHEVVHGLMDLPAMGRPACGYIPTGTVNDFATGIKLPKRILPAAKVAIGENCHAYDVGDMNGNYFTYVVAFGAFASVSYETSQAMKNLLGRTAYLLDGVTRLDSIKSTHVKVEVDGERWEEDCILGMVTNAKSVGGFNLYRKKKVALDDGVFDGIFVKKPKNPIELNQVMSFLLKGAESEQVYMIHGKEISIEAEQEIAYTLDGENGGKYKSALIRNHKQAITYYCGE